MRLVFSSFSETDFAELVTLFSKERSPDLTARFEHNSCKLIESLLQHPEMGGVRKDLKPEGIRSFRVRGFARYLLFYQLKGDQLILLRLRYGGMNLQTLFLSWE